MVTGPDQPGEESVERLTKADFEALARFRFGMRRFLRFSEDTVRRHGLTPQQYQVLLAIKGYPGRDWVTMRELADRLQLRHNTTVGLVDRAQQQGLVSREAHPEDGRAVRIVLTRRGEDLIDRLAHLHRTELHDLRPILAAVLADEQAD